MKTMAIRLEEAQHAQLSMIAQLEELTVTDAIRQAIEQWLEVRRDSPVLKQRAQAALEGIEQEAAERRNAITALLGSGATAPVPTDEPTKPASSNGRQPRDKGRSAAST
jgi:hypothetical protein